MLTKKFLDTIGLLMNDEDFDVRITVAKNATAKSRFVQMSMIEENWKEYIRDSIGSYLLTPSKLKLKVELSIAINGEISVYTAIITGNRLLNHFWDKIRYADGIRITITKNRKKISWIIVK